VVNDINSIFCLTADVLHAAKSSSGCHDLASEVVRVLSFPLQSSKALYPGMKCLLRIGMSLLRHFHENEQAYEQLASSILFFLFSTLPYLLKQDASVEASGLTAELSLTWLVTLLSEFIDVNVAISVESSLVYKVIRACLRNGLSSPTHGSTVNCLSLQVVTLLVRVYGDSVSSSSLSVAPRDVFDMVTSHSKFEDLFTHKDTGDDENTQRDSRIQEVMKLIITCILVSGTEIGISQPIWKTILCSFHAGLGRLDSLIRQLGSVCPEGSLPFSDEIRWNRLSAKSQLTPPPSSWDWLVDALDQSRLHATISSFPFFDTLDANNERADSWPMVQGAIENGGNEKSDDMTFGLAKKIGCGNGRKARSQGKDDRYSPAVLFPSLLGFLESLVSTGNPGVNSSCDAQKSLQQPLERTPGMKFSPASIDKIHRLCEKGIVGFCLAALSSSCEKIRFYAICLLGVFLEAATTTEARESSSWRDRPQLVMILDSVQRCLVLEKACSIPRGSDSDAISVPKLLPIVTLFLARASLALSRPDDSLYVPVNRYFLKTEHDHGAFQDLNRLPGFMALFCSSNEAPDQTRAERHWALKLLRDGIVDPACYRLAASCHAPELLLSSFENVRLSRTSDEAKGVEYCLLIQAITAMVENGGVAAHAHLFGRLGLLSWMRSYCTSRSLEEAFPTWKARSIFCKLVDSALDTAGHTARLRCSILREEAIGLIQPLASLCLIKSRPTEQLNDSILHDAVEGLDSIGRLVLTFRDGDDALPPLHDEIHPLGTTVETCLGILHLAERYKDDDRAFPRRTLAVLCSLPVSSVKESACSDDVANACCSFVVRALDLCLATDTGTDDARLVRLVMERIRMLVKLHDDWFASSNSSMMMMDSILPRLFSIRCKFCVASDETLQHLWLQCLELLSRVYKGENESLKFALECIETRLRRLDHDSRTPM
jgi:Nucleolar pre-ribosomal-associated protein 1